MVCIKANINIVAMMIANDFLPQSQKTKSKVSKFQSFRVSTITLR
jgi:hypothetical protein